MRPQQQGRRSRNRGGGRRNQNPLQRSFESNGPDVKIRGNAQVIADKYATLARDALSSGDSVMAENYLQHAEHYNRIIQAAQPQPREDDEQSQATRENGRADGSGEDGQGGRRNRDDRRRSEGGEDRPAAAEGEEQPVIEGTPAEVRAEQDEQSGESARARRPRQRRSRRNEDAAQAADGDDAQETAAQGDDASGETDGSSDDGREAPVAAE